MIDCSQCHVKMKGLCFIVVNYNITIYYYWIIGTGMTKSYKTKLNALITKITTLITG